MPRPPASKEEAGGTAFEAEETFSMLISSGAMLRTSLIVEGPAGEAWRVLTGVRHWPRWGPSVIAVECPDTIIGPGTTGRVITFAGFRAPFVITRFDPGRYWAWKVLGVAATGHRVEAIGVKRCRVTFEVPLWAAPYLVICRLALKRAKRLVEESNPPISLSGDPGGIWPPDQHRDLASIIRRDPMSNGIASLSHIERRRIEAEIAVPLIRAFEAEMGPERALAVVAGVTRELALEAGRKLAGSLGSSTIEDLAKALDIWSSGGALEIDILRADAETLDFNVTRCRYAEMYREMGAIGMGVALSCGRDFAFVEGFNPQIELIRTKTIMEGASNCDFRISLKR